MWHSAQPGQKQQPSVSFPPPRFIYQAGHHLLWNIPLDIWSQLSWLHPLQVLVALQPSEWERMRSWKVLDLIQTLYSNN